MINHVRTLLLNSRQDTVNPAPWDRYIPDDFQPLSLPPYLENIRVSLVGSDGWWDRTYRVEALLSAVYSARYDGKHDWLDAKTTEPRIQPFMYSDPEFSVTRVPAATPDVFVSALAKPYDKPVPSKRTWQVLASGSALFNVVYTGGVRKSLQAYRSEANNAWVLPVDVDLDMLFSGFGADGDIWQVESYKKPQNVFHLYPMIVKGLPSTWTAPLFSVSAPDESQLTEYKRWYQTCPNPEDPVVGVVLAYVMKASKLLV